MLENPRKLKNSPNLLLLFAKITKFLEFSKKITRKTILFSNSASQLHRPAACHSTPRYSTLMLPMPINLKKTFKKSTARK